MSLRQDETVTDYIEQFEALLAPLHDVPEDMLIGAFQTGLRLLPTGSLEDLMGLAQRVEERNQLLEHNREDFLARYLKTAVQTKWNGVKAPWTRLAGETEQPKPSHLGSFKHRTRRRATCQ